MEEKDFFYTQKGIYPFGQNFRVLIFGCPGTPIYELGEKLSKFYNLDFYTIERLEKSEDYFSDKIPTLKLDTGDFTSGSESQSKTRMPESLAEEYRLGLLEIDSNFTEPLNAEESCEILNINSGIIVTEISDPVFVTWLNVNNYSSAIFLESNQEKAIEWFQNRRKCFTCGANFHLKERPPKKYPLCDRCGSQLFLKKEDKPENVKKQYDIFKKEFENEILNELKNNNKRYYKMNIEKYESLNDLASAADKFIRKIK